MFWNAVDHYSVTVSVGWQAKVHHHLPCKLLLLIQTVEVVFIAALFLFFFSFEKKRKCILSLHIVLSKYSIQGNSLSQSMLNLSFYSQADENVSLLVEFISCSGNKFVVCSKIASHIYNCNADTKSTTLPGTGVCVQQLLLLPLATCQTDSEKQMAILQMGYRMHVDEI